MTRSDLQDGFEATIKEQTGADVEFTLTGDGSFSLVADTQTDIEKAIAFTSNIAVLESRDDAFGMFAAYYRF